MEPLPERFREYDPEEYREYEPVHPRGTDWRGILKKIWAPLVAVGAFLAKFGGLIFKGKFFVSIFVSAAVYVWIGGWIFGIGLVGLLFVHEMGHVLEAKRQGLPVSAPVFIPFLGAAITLKKMPPNAWREAQIALAGPLVGSAGAAAVWAYGEATDSRAILALAFLGFLLNLFNLLPIGFLDGGSIWRAIKTMRLGGTPAKATVGTLVYVGLAALLVLGMNATHVPRDF
jgi:Zn-dependent protease